jgi:hypothetical protein
MADTQDNSCSPDSAHRLDELLATLRDALAQDAAADVRAAGVVACRAILGALDPASRPGAPFTPVSPASPSTPPSSTAPTSPLAALLGALGQIPREQLLDVVGGLRWLFGAQGPTYLTRPTPTPPRSAGGGP